MSEQKQVAEMVTEHSAEERLLKHLRRHLNPVDLLQRYALIFVWALVVLIFALIPSTSSTFPAPTAWPRKAPMNRLSPTCSTAGWQTCRGPTA